MLLQYCSMALLMVYTKDAVRQTSDSPLYHRTHFSKASEEPCLLVLIGPLQILQKRDRASQRVEKINDRRTVSVIVLFPFELKIYISEFGHAIFCMD
jgi:hypothetical protein